MVGEDVPLPLRVGPASGTAVVGLPGALPPRALVALLPSAGCKKVGSGDRVSPPCQVLASGNGFATGLSGSTTERRTLPVRTTAGGAESAVSPASSGLQSSDCCSWCWRSTSTISSALGRRAGSADTQRRWRSTIRCGQSAGASRGRSRPRCGGSPVHISQISTARGGGRGCVQKGAQAASKPGWPHFGKSKVLVQSAQRLCRHLAKHRRSTASG